MKIKLTIENNTCPDLFRPGDTILDISASTNFWRTSQLLTADLILSEGNEIRKLNLTCEKESDEYDMLLEVSSSLSDTKRVLTFNGTGFDIPHLTKKYMAYRTRCPFEKTVHTDLRGELRKYSPVLPIESHKLRDYYSLVSASDAELSDADRTLAILPLLKLENFFKGQFVITDIVRSGDSVSFLSESDLPCTISYLDETFSVKGGPGPVEITAKLYDESLRMYHADFQNYMFLPLEGYAVHKSLASYIASSRKIPAVKETCFTRIPFNRNFSEDHDKVKKYLATVLSYTLNK